MTELLNDFLTGSVAWGVLLTLAAFGLGVLINRVTGKAIFNPLLLGSIFVIIFLSVCSIPYADYKASAAPVNYLLLPATVALAIPLYEKIDLLKENAAAIIAGISVGTLVSLGSALALALALGVACAVAVHWKIPVLRQIVGGYIELFRNTPLLVQLFFLYFALPKIGVRISAETCGKLGLGLLGGAYMAETFRSGLENIPIIQTESAQSLGLRPAQVFGYIILPQAVTSSVPGLLANLIFLLKETSVFSAISLMDLMFTAKDLIGMYSKTIECLFLLVVFYLIILLPVSIVGSLIERRLRYAGFGS